MKKIIASVLFGSVVLLLQVASAGCGAPNLCGPGSEACGGGCMPSGDVCCGSAGYCPGGYACGPGGTCVSGGGYHPSGCIAMGMESCFNTDGTTDCAPLGASCCGNHRYCPSGTVCGGNCGGECCP